MSVDKWISAWCSVTGSSHEADNLPCQDYSRVEYLIDSDFIIAAISDGAGSCLHSHIGSRFLVDQAIEKLATTIKLKMWAEDSFSLNNTTWREEAFAIFTELKKELFLKSEELSIEFKSLSATLIIAVSDGNKIACAHVGDGRAAMRDTNGEWIPMITPTKGEEANQTLFITSAMWDDNIQSDFFGTFYYDKPVSAFCILSDGCERASFEILKYDDVQDRYFDPNRPFKPFFEPNCINLTKMNTANLGQEKINSLWGDFIEKGTPALIAETDDKSMILSVCIPEYKYGGEIYTA